jgi:penicillin G amidase
VKRLLIAIVLLALAGLGAGWWWARGSVPSLDVDWTLAGLHGPVEVVSDRHGVPHVYARDTDDAWFAAGALHARDRLWQMELYRRASLGRLAEALGEPALAIDRRMLTLRIRAAADAEFARLGGPARAALNRYAEGVNAAMAGLQGRRRPLEFQLLGITPAPWTPQDSLAVGRLLAFRLAENVSAELVRHALVRAVGDDRTDELTGAYPEGGPTVLGELTEQPGLPPTAPPAASAPAAPSTPASPAAAATPPPSLAHATRPVYPAALAWLDPSAPRANSNAWVVSGKRTATGRPLLANDPHLLIEMPSVWYEMHLVAAGLDVQGVSLPGTPFVAIGHNARIAWGFTNTGADVQDLVLERFDLAGQRVQTAQGWEPVQVEAMTIPVRGRAAPAPFEVWRTSNGVVYADESAEWEAPPSWLTPDVPRQGEQRALVLRWSGFDTGNYADAIEALNRAGTWTDFQAALDRMSALSQNAVYADVDGNIGYLMTGQVPTRATGDGGRPLTGPAPAWTGTIGGPGGLPRAFNPARGFLATSNNRIGRSDVPFITRDWAAPFRAARITDRLASTPGIDVTAATALQLDVQSDAAQQVLQGLDGALARAGGGGNAAAVALLQQLKGWNRLVDGSESAAAFEAFEDRLWRRAFADDLPADVFRRFYQWAGAERVAGLYTIVGLPDSRWWDDIGTVERRESRDDIFLLAAADAVADIGQWASGKRQWDQVHAATFAHPIGEGGRLLAWFFNRGPVPVVGDGTTVMRISFRRLEGFRAWEHPSWRQVLDVGGWDNSKVVLPTGQSGHPLSPNYFDQNELWRAGQYRALAFSRGAVDGMAAHRQLLTP